MKITGLSKTGQKLLAENPGKTLMELSALGLSAKDYAVMEKHLEQQPPATAVMQDDNSTEAPAPEQQPPAPVPLPVELPPVVEKIDPKSIMPTAQLQQRVQVQPATARTGAVRYRNKKTGKRGTMNAATIQMMVKKYPDEYEIL